MKPHALLAKAAALLLVVLAAWSPELVVANDNTARLDAIFADTDGKPGALVGVYRDGEIVFTRAYGMANLTHNVPYAASTRTNIGSTAKQFTGFALALLADQGRLSLDDDVRKFVPELPDFGETVTVRHLLTHTSGYREFLNTLLLAGRPLIDGIDGTVPGDAIAVVQRQPRLQNAPGAEFNYNNSGYSLAALVIERITGESFPEWMATHIFAPLGMTDTAVRADPGSIVVNSAAGYVRDGATFREVRDIGGAAGAGGVYTTLADLARWMRNLHTGELGGKAVRDAMTKPEVATGGGHYGLGLFLGERRGLRYWEHGGGDTAHRSEFVFFPDLNAGYMVLTNHPALPPDVAETIAEMFFSAHLAPADEPPSAADPARAAMEAFDPATFAAELFELYVGRYELGVMPGFILTVFRDENGRMSMQGSGQPAVEIVPTSPTTFDVAGVAASISFHRDDDGSVPALTLHQNGNHRAQRLAPEPVDLTAYTGRYFSDELETFYQLDIDADQLQVTHRRFGPVTLTHARGDEFTGTLPILTLAFERDGDGRVVGFRVGNGRARDIGFTRAD